MTPINNVARILSELYVNGVISAKQLLSARDTALARCAGSQLAFIKLMSGKSAVHFLIDSGSDAHITSSKSVFVPGTVRKCSVNIIGITGSNRRVELHAHECGDVIFNLSHNESVFLRDVLFVPNTVLSAAADDCTVLVSVNKLARECNVSTRFDVSDVMFYNNDRLVGKYSSSSDSVYIISDSERKIVMNANSEGKEMKYKDDSDKDEKDSEEQASSKKSRRRCGSSLSRKDREKLSRKVHNRIHFGKTQRIRSFLKNVYGDDLIFFDDEPCDACMWSKAKFKPRPTSSHRKATRVGDRLHFDVFTSSVRSDDGCKYLLVVVDEFSGYIWAYGMRRRSETRKLIQLTVRVIEKKLSKRVNDIEYDNGVNDVLGVSSLRCDNAGENVLELMKKWCSKRGMTMETSVPHTPWQDGKAERMGGVVWQGGASLRYGGNLPESEWLRCCLAFVHVRNKLPSAACKHPTLLTPYEAYNDVMIPACELIEHFRRLGCVCHVVVPHSVRSGKPKKTFRAMMLGYSEEAGKKGYVLRDLSTGRLVTAAYNQVHCFESTLAFPASLHHDAWLNKRVKALADREKKEKARNKEQDDVDSCSVSSSSDEPSSEDNDAASDDEVAMWNEPNSASAASGTSEMSVMERLELGYPASSPSSPPATRSTAVESSSESVSNSPAAASSSPISPPPLSPALSRRSCISSDSDSDIEVIDDSESDISGTSEEVERGEWEVVGIKQSRRRGRGVQYQTEWKTGEVTWEPKSTFEVSSASNSNSFLPIFDLFNENAEKGIVGARASDCESDHSCASEFSENASGGSAVTAGTGQGANFGQELASTPSDPDASTGGVGSARADIDADVAVESREVGENGGSTSSTSLSSSADESPTVMLEHVALAIRTVKALVALEKAGIAIPENRREAMSGKYWNEFSEAEKKELNSFASLDVWELVRKPKGANVVGTRWVYDVKVNADGSIERFKARLVAQGFSQKEGIDFSETFAPTMHIKTARVLLTIAARSNIEARKYDVSTAFLHAALDKTVYVQQPKGHIVSGKEKWVYRLKKAMYGLKNAPKAYSDHFMSILTELGFKQSTRDSCLWSLWQGNYFVHYLYHVDDILVVSNHTALREACFSQLESRLRIRDEGPVNSFLGMEICRLSDGSYTMSQKAYIERVAKRFCIDDMSRPVETPGQYGQKLSNDDLPCTDEEKEEAAKLPFQELVGALLYVTKTRPDVAYAVSDISRFMSKWGVSHFKAALRVLRYVYSTREQVLTMNADAPMNLHVYVDANYGDERESEQVDDKWKSQGGFLVYLSNSLVSWRSRRHKARTHSSMESEYMEASEAAKEVLFFRMMLNELCYDQKNPTIMYEDNKACISFSKNNTSHDRTKHIDIRAYNLRDYVKDGSIKLMHIDTSEQLADMLTKHQLKHLFQSHVSKLFSGFIRPTTAKRVNAVSSCSCLSCFTSHQG